VDGRLRALCQRTLKKIRSLKKAVIFGDEMDGLSPDRGNSQNSATARVVNEFLVELTGNRPQKLDGAMTCRLQRSVRLGMPSFDERKALYTHYIQTVGPQVDSIVSILISWQAYIPGALSVGIEFTEILYLIYLHSIQKD